uniref:MADS32 n=1 Tax=Hippophae rhamnoides TaxID=193516 RepID=A0AAU7LJD2_9ROSA
MQNKRVTKGRQKVAMVKMSKDSNLQVTFSKRRTGLFKKASELCTLCGAEIVVIVFSPGKKVFSFGHPNVDDLIDRYLTINPSVTTTASMQLVEAHRDARVRELNELLTHANTQLEIEKKRGEELNQMRKASQDQYWWEKPIEELDMSQLQQLKSALEELRRNVAKESDNLLFQNSNPGNLSVGLTMMPNWMPSHTYNSLGEELEKSRKASRNLCWWEAPIDELSLVELQQLKTHLEELKKNVTIETYTVNYESIINSY